MEERFVMFALELLLVRSFVLGLLKAYIHFVDQHLGLYNNKKFERNTSLTHFLFYFIVGELSTYLHCYHKNGNNVNHGQMFL